MSAPAPTLSPALPRGFRPGMVLAFTLIILTLMSLMGVTILLNARTELSISSNTSLGRNAFASADTAVQIATLVGRILLHPELGPPDQVLASGTAAGLRFPLNVEINIDELKRDDSSQYFQLRYIRAGSWEGRASESELRLDDGVVLYGDPVDGVDVAPHIVFKTKVDGRDMTVATAALSLDHEASIGGTGGSVGGGLGVGGYDGGSGAGISVVLAVSVNGRAINLKPGAAEGRGGSFDTGETSEPRSIITVLFRELI